MRRYIVIALISVLFSISYWIQIREVDVKESYSAPTSLIDFPESNRSSGLASSVASVSIFNYQDISANTNFSEEASSSVTPPSSPRENPTKNIEDFSRYMSDMGGSMQAVKEDIEKKFALEVTDSGWAQDYEKKIKDMFVGSQDLNNFVPDSVVCKTNRCQVVMHASADGDLVFSADAFKKGLHENSSGLYKSEILAIPDFDKKIVILYINKNGESIYQ